MKSRLLSSLKRNPFQSVFASFALDILSEANNDNRYNERKVFTTWTGGGEEQKCHSRKMLRVWWINTSPNQKWFAVRVIYKKDVIIKKKMAKARTIEEDICLETHWKKIKCYMLWKTCLTKRIKMFLKINFRTYLTRIAGYRLSCSDLLLKSWRFWDRPKKVLYRCAQERRSCNTVEAGTTMASSWSLSFFHQ